MPGTTSAGPSRSWGSTTTRCARSTRRSATVPVTIWPATTGSGRRARSRAPGSCTPWPASAPATTERRSCATESSWPSIPAGRPPTSISGLRSCLWGAARRPRRSSSAHSRSNPPLAPRTSIWRRATAAWAARRMGATVCVKMDGDGQMSAADLDALVAPLLEGAADYAKGNRFVDVRSLRSMPGARLIGNGLLSFASKLASGYWNMLDVSNGFTAVRSAVLRRIDSRRLHERYFFETSMLIELNILGAVVADVEMPAHYEAEISSLRVSRVMLTFPGLLLRGLLRRFYWRYLIEDFGVVSISGLLGFPLRLFGVTFGTYHWVQSARTGAPATAGTVFVAALPIMLGFQLLLAT